MNTFYTDEKNTQMLIALMKAHGVRKIVISPGATNVCLVASLQCDTYFEIYSSVDERSAAYIACGMAAESGEAVALSCTGATASRNYIPGLTEAYYRKLPVLAITSTRHNGCIGQHIPQVIDRTSPLKDIVKLSVQIPTIHDDDDAWGCNVLLNKALLELNHHDGGPVHINLTTTYSPDFSVKELPITRGIKRICSGNITLPIVKEKVAIFVGAHQRWSDELTKVVDNFCEAYNGIVICDQTSNYRGKYRALASLVFNQKQYESPARCMDLMIHIGEVSGAYMIMKPKEVWRVSPDGEIRDTFKKLSCVYEMEEVEFFKACLAMTTETTEMDYWNFYRQEMTRVTSKIPELPFSNVWLAYKTAEKIPGNSVLYLGILNSLRTWNFFETADTVMGYANTGGFGIDGYVSSMIGASLINRTKLYFCVAGDLALFYDLNVLGNRHIGCNVRILLVNNGKGTEFRNYSHPAARFGEEADTFMAAAGHFGNQSTTLVKHYAEDLGYEYLSASNKEEYIGHMERFLSPVLTEHPIIFEVFTNSKDESDALKLMDNLEISTVGAVKKIAREMLGDKGVQTIKKILKH